MRSRSTCRRTARIGWISGSSRTRRKRKQRERLQGEGYRFVTQTDTEVIAHLIHANYRGDLLEAVRKSVAEFRGAYAIAAITTREPRSLNMSVSL